jgi:hypothetical protein
MNARIKEFALKCGAFHQVYEQHLLLINNNFDVEQFARLIIKDCALTAGLMEHAGRKGIGAQLLDNFAIDQ